MIIEGKFTKIEIFTNGEWHELGMMSSPIRYELTTDGPHIHIRADMTDYNRALDRAKRTLNRLRYPPKTPARGSVSRRREKLRKAGLRH